MTQSNEAKEKISPEAKNWAKQFDDLDTRNKIDVLEKFRHDPKMDHIKPQVLEMLMECYQLLMEDAYEELKRVNHDH